MTGKTLFASLAAGGVVLLLAACDEDKYTLKFSHHLHVTEYEMSCDECHGELGQPSFTALSHETCSDCHDEPDSKEIKPATCGLCHEGKLGEMIRDSKVEPKAVRKTVFIHTEALAEKCNDCHGAIMEEKLTSVPKLKRNEVIRIRDEAHQSGQDCLMCHINMDPDQRPADHNRLWEQRHGMFGMQVDAACSVCHSEDSCKECHSVKQPRNHNNIWRLKSHGAVASWDRERCMVCHEEDSCTSCHSQTRPRNHTARWSTPGSKTTPTHCVSCHTAAGEGEGCVVCHEGGNDVLGIHEKYWPDDNFHGIYNKCYDCHLYKYDK